METVEEIKRLLEDMQKSDGLFGCGQKACEDCEEKGITSNKCRRGFGNMTH